MKRIAIVFPYPFLDSVPVLISAIRMLARHYYVDVFTYVSKSFKVPEFDNEKITVYSFKSEPPATIFQLVIFWGRFFKKLIRLFLSRKYHFVFGVDQLGIIFSGFLKLLFRVRIAYFSLEIIFPEMVGGKTSRIFKRCECWAHSRSDFIVVLDKARGDGLEEANGVEGKPICVLPNILYSQETGRTIAKKDASLCQQAMGVIQKKFNIDSRKKILLHCGNLGPGMMVDKIVESAENWSKDWILVLHSRAIGRYDYFLESIAQNKALLEGRVKLSLEPYSHTEFDDFVSSAHIGFALKSGVNRNSVLSGLSSGKMLQYLKCGLPVIVNLAIEAEMVSKYSCGVTIQDPSEIKSAVSEIIGDYENFSMNSRLCYQSIRDYFQEEFNHILALI